MFFDGVFNLFSCVFAVVCVFYLFSLDIFLSEHLIYSVSLICVETFNLFNVDVFCRGFIQFFFVCFFCFGRSI